MGRPVRARASSPEEAGSLIFEHVRVTAVVATHNGAAFLPRTLEALTGQTRPVDHYIGVDAHSRDASQRLLKEGLPPEATVVSTSARGFGHSVAAGLAEGLPAAEPDTQDWLWLLHDDSAPASDALEHLLRTVETNPSVTIAGCKQLDADRPRRLLDVGLSMSRAGERLTMIEPDELDQGQYDSRSDAFAVNSAGLLIRRDAWEQLGGFDPALHGIGDDLDLAWRNRLAGHRVVVVPQARMYHVADAVKHLTGPIAARRAQVYLRLKHAPLMAVPFIALGALLGGLGRFLSGLVSKDPGYGAGQLIASLRAVLSPFSLLRSRRAAARTRRQRRSAIRPLLTDARDVREYRRHLLAESDADSPHASGFGDATEASNPSGDAHDDFAALATPQRTSTLASVILATGIAVTLSLLGLRHLIGAPALIGGSTLPVSARLQELWQHATTWWQPTGAGVAGPPDPFDMVLGALGLLSWGNTNAAVTVLVLAAMPLAALFAFMLLGALTRSRALRLIGALLWSLAPSLQVALAGGRLGAVVVHLFLPLVALGIIRSVGAARRRSQDSLDELEDLHAAVRPGVGGVPSWTAAAGAALALAVVVSAAPALLVPSLVLIVLLAVPLGRRAKTLWWVPVPALVATAGLMIGAVHNLRVLFADPGLPQAFAAAPLWQQALGFPVNLADGGVALSWLPESLGNEVLVPAVLVAAVLIALPVVAFAVFGALQLNRASGMARAAWAGALIALLASAGSQLIATGVDGGMTVTPFTGTFVSVAQLGLLVAAVAGASAVRSGARQSGAASKGRGRTAFQGLGAGAVVLSLLLAAGGWLFAAGTYGADMELMSSPERTLPATAADQGRGAMQARTLVITQQGGDVMAASLTSGVGSTLDAASAVAFADEFFGSVVEQNRRESDEATTALRATVAAIVSGQGLDPREDLRDLGVAFVVLKADGTEGDYLASQIDVVPGLAAVGQTDSGWLWRVHDAAGASEDAEAATTGADFAARVRVMSNDGVTQTLVPSEQGRVNGQDVPAGDAGRLLVLAERANLGWSATFNERPLRATSSGWAQAFELPAEAGTLEVRFEHPVRVPLLIVQGTVLVIALLLVLPFRARRRVALAQPRWRGVPADEDAADEGTAAAVESEEAR